MLGVGGKAPLLFFAVGGVQVTNLYRLTGIVRRRNLTSVPGKHRWIEITSKSWKSLTQVGEE